MIEYITTGSVVVVVAGWFIMHTRNHPSRKEIDRFRNDVQWKDVCNERTKRIEDAISNVDKKLDAEFRNLKELIRNKI